MNLRRADEILDVVMDAVVLIVLVGLPVVALIGGCSWLLVPG